MAIGRVIWGIVLAPDPQIEGDGAWTYTVLVNLPGHEQPITIEGIEPHDRTWDTSVWDIVSHAPLTSVYGLIDDHGQTQWFFNEGRASVECEGAGQPAGLDRLATVLRIAAGGGAGPGLGADAGGGGA
jgi:hypothetical protein